jgi:hypothetical protein
VVDIFGCGSAALWLKVLILQFGFFGTFGDLGNPSSVPSVVKEFWIVRTITNNE